LWISARNWTRGRVNPAIDPAGQARHDVATRFEIPGEISSIETFATGSGIRETAKDLWTRAAWIFAVPHRERIQTLVVHIWDSILDSSLKDRESSSILTQLTDNDVSC
jgi:hypothetical protein